MRRLGNDHHIVENRNSERGYQFGILPEDPGLVGLAVSIAVFENHDPIPERLPVRFPPIIDSLCHPNPAAMVDIDVRGVEKRGRHGPWCDFQPLG